MAGCQAGSAESLVCAGFDNQVEGMAPVGVLCACKGGESGNGAEEDGCELHFDGDCDVERVCVCCLLRRIV